MTQQNKTLTELLNDKAEKEFRHECNKVFCQLQKNIDGNAIIDHAVILDYLKIKTGGVQLHWLIDFLRDEYFKANLEGQKEKYAREFLENVTGLREELDCLADEVGRVSEI